MLFIDFYLWIQNINCEILAVYLLNLSFIVLKCFLTRVYQCFHILEDDSNHKVEILKTIKKPNMKYSYLQALRAYQTHKRKETIFISMNETENSTEAYKHKKICVLKTDKLFFTETMCFNCTDWIVEIRMLVLQLFKACISFQKRSVGASIRKSENDLANHKQISALL